MEHDPLNEEGSLAPDISATGHVPHLSRAVLTEVHLEDQCRPAVPLNVHPAFREQESILAVAWVLLEGYLRVCVTAIAGRLKNVPSSHGASSLPSW